MASEVTLSANTKTTSTAGEEDLFTAITAAGDYQLVLELNNLAGGDIYEFRCYTKVHTGGTERQEGPTVTFQGLLAPTIVRLPAFISPLTIRVSAKKVAGSHRAVGFSLYAV